MTEQELVKVVEMIAGLGDGAQEAFKWYLIADFAPKFLGISVVSSIILSAYILINRAMRMAQQENEYKIYLTSILQKFGIDTKFPDKGEIEFALKSIDKLQKEAAE